MSMRENKETNLDVPFFQHYGEDYCLNHSDDYVPFERTSHILPLLYQTSVKTAAGSALSMYHIPAILIAANYLIWGWTVLPMFWFWLLRQDNYLRQEFHFKQCAPSAVSTATQKITNQWLCQFSLTLEAILDQQFSPIYSIN